MKDNKPLLSLLNILILVVIFIFIYFMTKYLAESREHAFWLGALALFIPTVYLWTVTAQHADSVERKQEKTIEKLKERIYELESRSSHS